jgi:membrane-bound metal-dependent hydrolase YbcI (DUF457 family)
MFIGHLGAGMAGKAAASRLSLATAFAAAQWADLLWPVLLLTGVEHVRIVPGLMKTSPLDFTDYPVSHSLAALAGWAVLLAALHFRARRDPLTAAVVAALVLSHWFLDVLMHRRDVPVWPGGPRVGLGLWNSVAATVALEAGIYGAGIALYLRKTRSRDRVGSWGLGALLVFLFAGWAASLFGPPPPGVGALAWTSIALGLLILLWAYWVDAHRRRR